MATDASHLADEHVAALNANFDGDHADNSADDAPAYQADADELTGNPVLDLTDDNNGSN